MYLKKGNEMPTKQQKIHRKTPEKLLKTDLKNIQQPSEFVDIFLSKGVTICWSSLTSPTWVTT